MSRCIPAVADYPAGARLPMRVIDDYEFVWMLRGRARLVTPDDSIVVAPGHLLLIPPGFRHGFEWDQQHPSRHGYVHFPPEYVGAPVAAPRLVRMSGDNPIGGLCAYLLALGEGEQIDHTVRYLVSVVLADAPERPVSGPLLTAVSHLRREWADLPLHRVSVHSLAAASSVTRGYLNRLFQAEFGLSVGSALERVRCSRAETLLTRTDLTVDAVARACGFADVSHFSHRFTTIHGMPPSAYPGNPSVLDHPGVRRLTRLLWR
ncbi:transcriptional regulator, AraC family [Micromonospora rhizosphaerae]|uniref:Transcriptional regulator, AraC family n=1 Tax=Micromonospora rhizosphaerae TaxID=568872 RepID=A0A1C6SK11_9ACTN|nr:transcriptional regulator, AraC family [Micromonospora rhizosphaerae]